MPDCKIAVQLASLRLPAKEALKAAAELGAHGVQIDARGDFSPARLSHTGRRQLRKILDDFRLKVAAVGFHTRGTFYHQSDLDRRVEAAKSAMQFASELRAPVVVSQLGRIPPDRDSPERRLLVEVLADLGRHGQRVGALLAAETGSDPSQTLAELIDQLPEFSLGVDLNPGKVVGAGFSPVEAAAMLGPSILLVHATDAKSDSGPRAEDLPPGQGDVDYPALLGALDEHDYRGYFAIGAPGPGSPAGEIARSIEFLRRL